MNDHVTSGFPDPGQMAALLAIAERHRGQKGGTIALLQEIEEAFGYIPERAVGIVAEELGIPEVTFFGVATFYAQFHMKPRGRNVITACSGTACHVKGSDKIISALMRELNLAEGEETTPDMEFTVEKVNCVGACSIAPVVIINKKVHGKSTTDKTLRQVKALRKTELKADEE